MTRQLLQALATSKLPVQAKSGAYTVVDADRESVFSLTGTWTLVLTAAVTLATGFGFYASNDGTGTITVDPNSSETINGFTTEFLFPGESAYFWTDGTVWRTLGLDWKGWRPIEINTPLSAVAAWTRNNLSWASALKFEGKLRPVTNAVDLYLRLSTDNGSSFDATSTHYVYAYEIASAGTVSSAENGASGVAEPMALSVSNNGSFGGATFEMLVEDFNKSMQAQFSGASRFIKSTTDMNVQQFSGRYSVATPRDAVQVLFQSGNIADGRISLWGLRG